jgi:alanine-alpha-ketoisovalerate/valine-pyruvate aminotransferase
MGEEEPDKNTEGFLSSILEVINHKQLKYDSQNAEMKQKLDHLELCISRDMEPEGNLKTDQDA